jgi:hypothetical protein
MDAKHRDIQLKIRLSQAEYDRLAAMAHAKGASLAAIIRQSLYGITSN